MNIQVYEESVKNIRTNLLWKYSRDLQTDIPEAISVSDQGVCHEVWIGLAGAVPLIDVEAWRSAGAWHHHITWSLAGRLTLPP